MKRALILALLILVAAACDTNYDPPKPYAVGNGYGSNGRAYAAQQSPSIFVFIEVVEEADARASGDAATEFDLPTNVSEVVESCIAEYGELFAPWCLCLEDRNRGESEDVECRCEHLVCVADSPDPTLEDIYLDACKALLAQEPDKLLGPCAP